LTRNQEGLTEPVPRSFQRGVRISGEATGPTRKENLTVQNIALKEQCNTQSPFCVEIVEGFGHEATLGARPLAPFQVVVALATPDRSADAGRQAQMKGVLSACEMERFQRFRLDRDRQLFLVAHALLRSTLSLYADVEPAAWQFRAGSHARPEIVAPRVPLRFSLAHTSGMAACAVTLEHDIGIDVEEISGDARMEVADRCFSLAELADLGRVSADRRAARFFEYWTLKEAYLKARGVGLSVPLDGFSLRQDVDNSWRIIFESPMNDDPARWSFWSRRVGESHQAALAVSR